MQITVKKKCSPRVMTKIPQKSYKFCRIMGLQIKKKKECTLLDKSIMEEKHTGLKILTVNNF